MIDRITIKNFKSFMDVTVNLGPMNIFIGPNASGKSNFFDALRVLQGIGYGFTLREILDGKPKSATSEVWDGIRGGSAEAAFAIHEAAEPISFEVVEKLRARRDSSIELAIAFSAREGRLRNERLAISEDVVYDSRGYDRASSRDLGVYCYGEGNAKRGAYSRVRFHADRPVLAQLARRDHREPVYEFSLVAPGRARPEIAESVAQSLADMQRVDPLPTVLREYSKAYEITRMGEQGENFAALVRMICNDPQVKEAYLSWLKELRPREVDDVGVLKGALGEPMVMVKEGDREWPAPVLSEGTLRFAAIAAAFFQPDMPGIMTIEEIENGIHASRLRLLVELLRSRTAERKTQVMLTTHSPIVLAWLQPAEYATTFYCHRDEETGESRIVPLSEIPRFNEIVSKQPISDLIAEGWLETAL